MNFKAALLAFAGLTAGHLKGAETEKFFVSHAEQVIGCFDRMHVLAPNKNKKAPTRFGHPTVCGSAIPLYEFGGGFKEKKNFSNLEIGEFSFEPMFTEGEVADERLNYGTYKGLVKWQFEKRGRTFFCSMGLTVHQTTLDVVDGDGRPVTVDDGDYSLEISPTLSCTETKV